VSAPVLTVDDARDPAAEQVISEGLRRYNEAQCGISDGRALNVVARDPETNAPLGGITGHTSLGVLFIDRFFLPEVVDRDTVVDTPTVPVGYVVEGDAAAPRAGRGPGSGRAGALAGGSRVAARA